MDKTWVTVESITGRFDKASGGVKRMHIPPGVELNTSDPEADYYVDTTPSDPDAKPREKLTPFERWKANGAIRLSSPLFDVLEHFDARQKKPSAGAVVSKAKEAGITLPDGSATGAEITEAWEIYTGGGG